MPEYLTPGVYVEEVSFRAPSIEGVGTSTTGFAGVTLTGPMVTTPDTKLRTPELLTSFGDFQNVYGSYNNLKLSGSCYTNYMAMAVKAFFDNGGSQLYVSRVFAQNSQSDAGIATSGAPTTGNVTVSARFPGASGNQQVTIALKAARTQNVSSLPAGSLVTSAANISSLANPVATTDSQIILNAPLPWTPVARVLVDSEVMTVNGTDITNTKLTVSRSAPAAHAAGAVVMGQVGFLFGALNSGGQQVTISSAPQAGTTTPAPTTTGAGTTTTPAPTTTAAPASATAPAGIPAVVQIDAETFFVTQVDSTGTVLTLDHKAQANHTANAPIFSPITMYANSSTGQFQSGSSTLPATAPAGLYVLTMQVTANTAAGTPAVFDGLGFDPVHPYYLGTVLASTPPRHVDALQNQVAFAIGTNLTQNPATAATSIFSAIFPNWAGPNSNASFTYTLQGGDDGAEPESTDFGAALAMFTSLEDIAIVGAPGSGAFQESQDIINSLITHVSQQRAYRVAILETPPNQLASDNEGVRAAIDSSYAALYAPWVYTPNPLATAGSAVSAEIAVPPTGFMAGIWARSDEQNGVSKAPANEVILGASRLERDISFAEQGILNPLGINCLRFFPNRGYRVWGARTTSSDTEFMYLNVRRYLVYLEHSIDNSTQWAVFENNGPALWSQVKESIDSFLYSEWASGNLLGDNATQAYFVRCDRTTMTQNDLDNGRMICLIGVAVLKPAEFVIFRIGQTTALGQS
jgi:phage tail sheath protein FI